MTSLRDFIAARLDEDEAVALAAAKDAAGYSHGYPNDPISEWRINDEGDLYADHIFLAGGAYGGGIDEKFSAHLVRHDPARVLREVAAKRAVLDAHGDNGNGECETCLNSESDLYGEDREAFPCWHLKIIAAIYSDHPDYREEWAA